jgi:hypothetical protein
MIDAVAPAEQVKYFYSFNENLFSHIILYACRP